MIRVRLTLLALLLMATICSYSQSTANKWTEERIWDWYNKQPWLCGFNYIPAYAINYTAMWDKTTYDPAAIETELALAEKSGMNTLRVVLQYAVYEDDPQYFLHTLDGFMKICEKHDIKFIPALFDDCSFGITPDPKVGKQPEPLKGWYAWAWSPSPGHSMVTDTTSYPKLEKYVKTVINRFKDDKRVLLWDLYNEPTNGGLGTTTLPLLKKVISWAREINPSQPLSIGAFDNNQRLNDIITGHSDVITFHEYGNRETLLKTIGKYKKFKRPLINTEWMNRPFKSTIPDVLDVFYENKIGCTLWGLVNGKTQTELPWGHRPGDPEQKLWQHDLYHGDLKPYDVDEISLLTKLIKQSKTEAYAKEHMHAH